MRLAHPRRRGLTSPLNAAAHQPRARLTPSWNTNRVGDDNARRRGNKTNTFTSREPCVDAFRTHFCTPELIAGRYADPARYKFPSKQLRARDTHASVSIRPNGTSVYNAAVPFSLCRSFALGIYQKNSVCRTAYTRFTGNISSTVNNRSCVLSIRIIHAHTHVGYRIGNSFSAPISKYVHLKKCPTPSPAVLSSVTNRRWRTLRCGGKNFPICCVLFHCTLVILSVSLSICLSSDTNATDRRFALFKRD